MAPVLRQKVCNGGIGNWKLAEMHRKLQQMQIKLDEGQTKEQGTLAKLQECIQIVEQGQFEKNEVFIVSCCCCFSRCSFF